MKLQKITVNGQNILGTIKNNTIVGSTSSSMSDYLKNKAMGKLVTMTVGDKGTIVTTDLTAEQEIEFERLQSLFKAAKKQTKATITCQIFDKMLGK